MMIIKTADLSRLDTSLLFKLALSFPYSSISFHPQDSFLAVIMRSEEERTASQRCRISFSRLLKHSVLMTTHAQAKVLLTCSFSMLAFLFSVQLNV